MPSIGETFRVSAVINDLDGTAIEAGLTHLIYIVNPSGTTVLSSTTPTNALGGNYYLNFLIPAGSAVGLYTVIWETTYGTTIGIDKLKIWGDDP